MNEWIISIDPQVLDFWKSVGTVIVAVIAAAIASAMQWRQGTIARNKLRMDMFDKRFKLYNQLKEVVSNLQDYRYQGNELANFDDAVEQCRWIFNEEVFLVVNSVTRVHVNKLDRLLNARADSSDENHGEQVMEAQAALRKHGVALAEFIRPYMKIVV
jgi:hypothetical protein